MRHHHPFLYPCCREVVEEVTLVLRHPRSGGTDGFGIVPTARVLPHFDRYSSWLPGFAAHLLAVKDQHTIGIDEETALVAEAGEGDNWTFRVTGRQSAWLIDGHGQTPVSELTLRVSV